MPGTTGFAEKFSTLTNHSMKCYYFSIPPFHHSNIPLFHHSRCERSEPKSLKPERNTDFHPEPGKIQVEISDFIIHIVFFAFPGV
jgi:hypothetical protein